MFDDSVLVDMYVDRDTPCDRLVSNPQLLEDFAHEYRRRTGADVTASDVGHRMLNLRRLGQDKGGLPRLRRRYRGRGNQDN